MCGGVTLTIVEAKIWPPRGVSPLKGKGCSALVEATEADRLAMVSLQHKSSELQSISYGMELGFE